MGWLGDLEVFLGHLNLFFTIGARARAQMRIGRLRLVEAGSPAEAARRQQRCAARLDREAAARAEHAAVRAGAFFRHARLAR